MKFSGTICLYSLAIMLSMSACKSEETINDDKKQEEPQIIPLKGSGAKRVKLLLPRVDIERSRQMGRISISPEEYKEIADFTKLLTKGWKTETERFNCIYTWIRNNIKYKLADNRPYAVFKNKYAICQGYADLLKVMCHTENIPTRWLN